MAKVRRFNYIEKNIAMLAAAPRVTAHNLVPLKTEPKPTKCYGRKGHRAWGTKENMYARELGDDGRVPPWYLWVAPKEIKNSGFHYTTISLGLLQHKIDTGILDPAKITMYDLLSQHIVDMPFDYTGIRLDIQGISMFEAKVNIEVTMACERTIEAIERNGGTVLTRWYSKEQLDIMRGGSDPSSCVVLPPLELVHKYLDPHLRGYMIGREYLYFRNLQSASKILEHMRKKDITAPRFNDEGHNDILQERIDANIRRAERGFV